MSEPGSGARIRAAVLQVSPYRPGRPAPRTVATPSGPDVVELASNENCLGTSPLALDAGLRALARGTHLYPDGASSTLRRRLAGEHGVGVDNVFVASGATEAILLLAQVMLEPGASAIYAEGAFHLYHLAVQLTGAVGIAVPLDPDERHDLAAMQRAIRPDSRLCFIANPNNPTGTYVGRRPLTELATAIPRGLILVVDEAYDAYVDREDYPNAVELVQRGLPVVVLRTFSKVHGLAGMRVGYAIAPADVVDALDRARSAFNVSGLAQEMALAALDDRDHVRRSRDHNRVELAFLSASIEALGYRTTPSVANFLLVDVGRPAEPVYESLANANVIVRPMRAFGFPQRIRVTVGTRAGNERFLRALAEVPRAVES